MTLPDEAIAGTRIPKMRFGPAAEPQMRGATIRQRVLLDQGQQLLRKVRDPLGIAQPLLKLRLEP